jgi:hypothetical protein
MADGVLLYLFGDERDTEIIVDGLLETYHGAPVIVRRSLDWKAWRILVFEGRAHPH